LQAQRLNQVLTSAASPTPTHLVEIPDAGNGPAIRQPLIRFGRKWELDYTGGTKAMAAHARLALAQVRADADEVASYVDHSTDSLRFDNGKRVSLKSKGLTLASIATLHGGTLTLEPSRFVPDMEWLTKFARDYLRDLSRAGSSIAKADAAQRHTNRLRKNRVDAPWAKELRDRPGLWLEWLVHDRVLAALATVPLSQREAVIGARFRPFQAADDAEVDVLLRVGWRVRLLSCDTSRPAKRGNADHKKKALEAQARARQIGGDASRAALVTLLEPVGVSAITRHLSPVEVGAPARVFGQNDLQRWLDDDLTDLSDWCSR
jgi:hypothetical protein